jgi:hypothetical protein
MLVDQWVTKILERGAARCDLIRDEHRREVRAIASKDGEISRPFTPSQWLEDASIAIAHETGGAP